jgi:hypothetical protein
MAIVTYDSLDKYDALRVTREFFFFLFMFHDSFMSVRLSEHTFLFFLPSFDLIASPLSAQPTGWGFPGFPGGYSGFQH